MDAMVMGRAKDIITRDRAKGESSLSLKMSHPRVICCMYTAVKAKKVLRNNQRKSRYRKDEKAGNRFQN